MVEPEPALAPVIPPVIVPIVQLKLLGTVAESAIARFVPLQMVDVAGVDNAGVGLTVTVILNGVPAHEPAEEVGVTI